MSKTRVYSVAFSRPVEGDRRITVYRIDPRTEDGESRHHYTRFSPASVARLAKLFDENGRFYSSEAGLRISQTFR